MLAIRENVRAFFFNKPHLPDVLILSLFTVIVTFHPFYLYGRINLFENGIYLPCIDAVLHGQIPYRDFFYLRGPFEIYVPAALMSVFGAHLGVLATYFYVGTVLGLLACIFIGRELYRTRLVLYLMVPVLVARTFPRVVFTYWGGMRYALGLLALFFAIKYFKCMKKYWIFWSGFTAACGLFTSVEIGVCVMAGVLVVFVLLLWVKLIKSRELFYGLCSFGIGMAVVVLPYVAYLISNGAFIPYLESTHAVVANMQKVINPHLALEYPSNVFEAIKAMVTVTSKNFRHMTPSYLYLFLIFYIGGIARKRKFALEHVIAAMVGIYGLTMYNAAFRGIWASQFEMALQPEKILYFYLLERIYFVFSGFRDKTIIQRLSANFGCLKPGEWLRAYASRIFIILVIVTSLGYALQRYSHRFFVFKYVQNVLGAKGSAGFLKQQQEGLRFLKIERAKSMVVPIEQAQELEFVVDFIRKNSGPNEVVFTYPQSGTYNFLADRPFLGRFPMATFSWFKEEWHRELMADFSKNKPKFVIVSRDLPADWERVYLAPPENRRKYRDVMEMIRLHYRLCVKSPQSDIYRLRKE